MSRGGSSFRGGRGGPSLNGKARIGGVEMPWQEDPDLTISSTPSEIFPAIDFPSVRPPTHFEKQSVVRFRALRRRIHEGPFYTGPLGEIGVRRGGEVGGERESGDAKRKREFDPFGGMASYSAEKYRVQPRRLPRFDTREYQLRYFPPELWSTLSPSLARKYGSSKPSALPKAKRPRITDLDDEGDAANPTGNPEDAENAPKGPDDDEDNVQEENLEENFSEDDSEMGQDYNAELYFDGGDDDEREIDEAGGGDGDYD